MSFSSNLLNTDKREIGLWLLRFVWESFLKTGITLANLNLSGTILVRKDVLNITCKGPANSDLRIFRIEIGILEGPTALPVWSLAISNWISSAVTGHRNKLSHMGGGINLLAVFEALGMELGRLPPMLAK